MSNHNENYKYLVLNNKKNKPFKMNVIQLKQYSEKKNHVLERLFCKRRKVKKRLANSPTYEV